MLNMIFVDFSIGAKCDRSEIIYVEEVQKYATRDLHRVQAHVPQKFIRKPNHHTSCTAPVARAFLEFLKLKL
jgi:hypothetical protein